ncbi:MAG: M20 family metallo-hydrolase [Candidatus Micrarchaeaceae archaeon]
MPSIFQLIDSYKEDMVKTISDIIAIPAIAPQSGGSGESKRADYLEDLLKHFGQKVKRYDYKDTAGSIRSNLVTTFGSGEKILWILSHIDTVSAGDLSLWAHDPFKAYVKSGKIYGRGTSDNGQGVVSSLFALKALKESNADLKYRFGLALVADEETGSEYGAKKLISEGLFRHDDLMLVPDDGNDKGSQIEIAEKGILWLRFKVHGKQVHASTPALGVNAYRVSIQILSALDKFLHSKYAAKDKLFKPPYSTFEMTKHEANVDSTNIVPGSETFYMDCRILPIYNPEKIRREITNIAERIAAKSGASVEIETVNEEIPAKPTPASSTIVQMLIKSINAIKHVEPELVGIGGGTVAKFFRDLSMHSAVWATLPDNAHQPNEYLKISDMVTDAKVFASLFV